MSVRILQGDCRSVLKTLPDESVHCCVTSPPYFGLRDYGTAQWEGGDLGCDHIERNAFLIEGETYRPTSGPTRGGAQARTRWDVLFKNVCGKCGARRIDSQIGLEPTPAAYVAELVSVFREVRRVLRSDGVLFLNLGDSYASTSKGSGGVSHSSNFHATAETGRSANGIVDAQRYEPRQFDLSSAGLKPKDLIGIPWMVAFALRADGWWLRQDIIWQKPNPMPESVRDRCCKSHEYLFLLSKSERYYFDSEAIAEDVQSLQHLSSVSAGGRVQQEQSAEGWADRQVSRVSSYCSQEVEPEVQPVYKSPSNSETLLLFGEGAREQKNVSQILCDDPRAARQVSRGWEESREGGPLQGTPQTVRQNGQGTRDKSEKRQKILPHGQWPLQQKENGNKAEAPDQISELYTDPDRMGEDQRIPRSSMRVLPPTDAAVGNGSCDPLIKGRSPYSREHCPSVQVVQRQEEQQATKRTKRSVWTVATQPFPGSHFAVFPPALIEPCILAGCPAKCCAKCGAPWVRDTIKGDPVQQCWAPGTHEKIKTAQGMHGESSVFNTGHTRPNITLGFSPSCKCNAGTVPGTVLDPFGGAGTTGLVADRHQRNAILVELNPDYVVMSRKRCDGDAPLFAEAAE